MVIVVVVVMAVVVGGGGSGVEVAGVDESERSTRSVVLRDGASSMTFIDQHLASECEIQFSLRTSPTSGDNCRPSSLDQY